MRPTPPSLATRSRLLPAATIVAVLAVGCAAAGPDYVRPTTPVPANFKEAAGWKAAQPLDAQPKGPWWDIFGDAELSQLERQVSVSNQNVAQAAAQYRAARAAVAITRAGGLPLVGASASTSRARSSTNGATRSPTTSTVHTVSLDATWEPDLWGGVRRAVEGGVAGAQASAADLEAMRLSMQAELAQDYFGLRALDAERQIQEAAIADDERTLELTRNRYAAGVVPRSDAVQAEALLRAAQAQASDIGVQRAQFEHAIAVLVGKPPAEFSLARAPLGAAPPEVPVGVPSDLLERRPDIAGAERRVAAANAQIGVAQAAFYPALTLSATVGTSFASALDAAPLLWSAGSTLAQTLFDGGARRGRRAQAVAEHDAAVAAYRLTVLSAFQEVEDQLAASRILAVEARQQADAVAAAREAVTLVLDQYRAGTVSYLDVLSAQQIALADQQLAATIAGRRYVARVALVRALGGGWTSERLPDTKAVAAAP